MGCVVRTRAVERPIPDETPSPGKLQEVLGLLGCWVHAELKGFLDRTHRISVSRTYDTYRHTLRGVLQPLALSIFIMAHVLLSTLHALEPSQVVLKGVVHGPRR